MILNRHLAAALCVLATGVAGCQQTPVAGPVDGDPTLGTTVAPVSERDLERQKAFADAIDGLRFDGGTITVDRRLPGDATDAQARFDEGETLMSTNRRTESIKAFAHAIRIAPNVPEFYIELGHALITKGKTAYAAAAYRTAADLDAENVDALSNLALTLARDGQDDEAIETMNAALAIDPDNGFAHERLAIWHYYAGHDDAAWEHVRQARRVGHPVPPQFVTLLERRSPQP